MIYKDLLSEKVSMLGFGAMRLPTLENGEIDLSITERMIVRAIDSGVNYFDTAYPYHGGLSEVVLGKILKRYPRNKFLLANKYPGHQLMKNYDPAAIFEEQLEKCGVEYFDFYLLHNVYERSLGVYTDKELSIIDYFREQKRRGRIRHLGFSTHAMTDCVRDFLDVAGDDMEFCQIQMNYLDYTLQDAKGKYDLLTERGIPVVVMEPVRGGRLASLDTDTITRLHSYREGASAASFAFRWLMDFDNISVVLSGMSNMEQLADNLATFDRLDPLTDGERKILRVVADGMMNSVPCTACRYCIDGCPLMLDIPQFISTLNELRVSNNLNASMRIELLSEDKKPDACLRCGACSSLCPQSIDIPTALAELAERVSKMPKWSDISREREDAAERLKAQRK